MQNVIVRTVGKYMQPLKGQKHLMVYDDIILGRLIALNIKPHYLILKHYIELKIRFI